MSNELQIISVVISGISVLISAISVIVTITLFWRRLNKDTELSSYKEAIGFINSKEGDLNTYWGKFVADYYSEAELKKFFNSLNHVSFLIKKEVVNSELIYNAMWHHFYDPIKNTASMKFIEQKRECDKSVYSYYIDQCKEWEARIEREMNGG